MLKSKKQWSLCKCTLKKLDKLAVLSNFLTFFPFLVDKFALLDPDTGGKNLRKKVKKQKKCKEIGDNWHFIIVFTVNLASGKLRGFYTFQHLFGLLPLQKTLHKVTFHKLVEARYVSALRKKAGSGSN